MRPAFLVPLGLVALALLAPAASAGLLEARVGVEAPGLLPPVDAAAAVDGPLTPALDLRAGGATVVRVGTPAPAPEAAGEADPAAPAPAPHAPPAAVAAVGLGLTGALHALAGALMPLYSRIGKAAVLQNPARARLLAHVQDHPGTSVTEAARALGLGWGTTVHHLDRLEREGYVASQPGRGERLLFAVGAVSRDERALAAASRGTAGRLLAHVAANPGACQSDLAAALGLQAPAASKHLARLVKEGLLRAEREWRTVRYFPAGPAMPAAPVARAPAPGAAPA